MFLYFNSYFSSVQNQINIHSRINREHEFGCENEKTNKRFSELHFLNNRLEQLANQKNNCKFLFYSKRDCISSHNIMIYLTNNNFFFRFNKNWIIIW